MWDPVAGTRAPVARDAGGWVTVCLAPFGSCFLVPATDARPGPHADETPLPRTGPWTLSLPETTDHVFPGEPTHWQDLTPQARGFAGIGEYRTIFRLDAPVSRARVRFGDVADIAEVTVNGVACGIMWTAPFEAEVGHALREGENVLVARVATPWRNRLIAEAAAPSGEVPAAYAAVYLPDAAPLPAGIQGPVSLCVAATEA